MRCDSVFTAALYCPYVIHEIHQLHRGVHHISSALHAAPTAALQLNATAAYGAVTVQPPAAIRLRTT
eukprot:19226-Heterococcus_DN1.PRE.3